MDFVGQEKARRFFTIVLWAAGIIGFVVGMVTRRFLHTFLVLFAGFVVSAVVCIPSWPYFNKNRLAFQKVPGAKGGKGE